MSYNVVRENTEISVFSIQQLHVLLSLASQACNGLEQELCHVEIIVRSS